MFVYILTEHAQKLQIGVKINHIFEGMFTISARFEECIDRGSKLITYLAYTSTILTCLFTVQLMHCSNKD